MDYKEQRKRNEHIQDAVRTHLVLERDLKVEAFDGWNVTGAEGDVTVLVRILLDNTDGPVPELNLTEGMLKGMRREILLHMLDHEDVEEARGDFIAVQVTEKGSIRVRHIVGAVEVKA